MKVLVTGGAGFIGSHVVERLVADGRQARVLDNFSSGRRENLAGAGDAIEVVEGDVRERSAVADAVAGCDAVIHLAALVSVQESIADPLKSHDINVTGTLNVLVEAQAAGARRVVFASSAAVYGPDVSLPAREDAAHRSRRALANIYAQRIDELNAMAEDGRRGPPDEDDGPGD